jgi:hypothetical protein
MKHICKQCKEEFETQSINRVYCSDLCAGKARRRKIKEASAKYQRRILSASKGFEGGVT